jgi:hypothetical protein
VFPNPACNQITIAGAAGCVVALYDVVGARVLELFVQSNQQVLDISSLHQGVYSAEVTDPQTGMRIVKRLVKE